MTEDTVSMKFHRRNRKIIIFSSLIALVLLFLCFYGLSVSQYPISFTEAYGYLFDHINGATYDRDSDYESWLKDIIVWDQNLPRVLAGLMIGSVLAIGGCVIQSIIRNPLADPYTTGISSGALFGVALFLVYGYALPLGFSGTTSMVVSAFIFAMIPTAMIAILTVFRKTPVSPTSMILIGIGTMYIFSSGASIIRFYAEPNVAQSVYEWTVGSLGKIRIDDLPIIFIALVIIVIFSIIFYRHVDALSEGDEVAKSIGTNPKTVRLISLVIISLCTAIVVCYAGTIAFIGLVCPHIARGLMNTSSCKYLIPFSALIGALMLVSCDIISKIITETGLPVGVITALIGSPIFVLILIKQRKESF